ncbi:bifunctional alpha,alpha-trehalose-phosphate synthase (UDP-forming)/trehalose-phosphatase [Pseudobacteriovorax antillogorgiicola]|uniref:Trehalose 6-phosphate synthase /trehalose 6-phosphatase n=1 Tax=Pseudobacteriovorax antillogorgiicola TaxID=1513793 RepID=A0A1Y6BB52_9BACT|nr:bifunctional alpha,alpha-trehalose-phosphate synthase (UDP-forming)/trehalose-phosphatase [Pseudobacteriovorax antillogorgiicola]TCS57474.1 trehalose 6-phosphate synthase /trehalose 6-phosphatase [Pseudobacteriovorax antillogorgiicola]SMF00580.1 trehalose 6-phosphate synthase /trehalose 6-phosphatase [Pseudobacteriovorax antillogorgiicola]
MTKPKRQILVSNRLPVSIRQGDDDQEPTLQRSSGGLVRGLNVIHHEADSLWVGHLGQIENGDQELTKKLLDEGFVNVELDPNIYDRYYSGYANDTLWPLFHNFLASMSISDNHWDSYQKVNQQFAEKIIEILQPDDWIWIHDYQLMLLPQILREHDSKLKISYFHHIPFPSSEIFSAIPRRQELMCGLLGADYIGFHTNDYVRHFMATVKRVLGAKTKINEINHDDRSIKVSAHPLGVDFGAFSKPHPQETPPPAKLSDKERVTFLGIDRLDYTKGIPERLTSFARFLDLYPEYIGKARLTQICVPSRQDVDSYAEIRNQVERLVGNINGKVSSTDYIPVEYIFRSIPTAEVIDLYQKADVMVVTPLRDGLNLVCKEYVVSRTDSDGCLVLSEFAGSASEMGEALQVNPYDIENVAHTFNKALQMGREERQERMTALRKRMEEHDNRYWAQNYLEAWSQHEDGARSKSIYLNQRNREDLIDKLSSKQKIHLFLDYDGTLAPIQDRPEMAVPDQRLDRFMGRLAASSMFDVAIVTGRPKDFCDEYLTSYKVPIAAEHGSFIRFPEDGTWEKSIAFSGGDIKSLQAEILDLLESCQKVVPRSHIEAKETCIVWHYRESEPDFADQQAHILADSLEQMLNKTSWSVYHGNKTVEIRPSLVHKGFAVEFLLKSLEWSSEKDSFLTIGDDTTDEDMHRVHIDHNISIHIGSENPFSKYYLKSPDDLYEFLNDLLDKFEESPSQAS